MKEKILEAIKDRGGNVTFAELDSIEGFRGNYTFTNEKLGERNIFMWFSCSKESADALIELFGEKKIEVRPTSILTYLADGMYPSVPIARQARRYKSERWTPVVLNLSKEGATR